MVFARLELVFPYSLSLPPWVEMEPAADSLPLPAGPVLLICRSEGILWRSCHCGWRRERLSSQPVGTRKMTSVSRIKKIRRSTCCCSGWSCCFCCCCVFCICCCCPPSASASTSASPPASESASDSDLYSYSYCVLSAPFPVTYNTWGNSLKFFKDYNLGFVTVTVWAEMLLPLLLLQIIVSVFAAALLLTCSSISLMSHCPLAIFCSDTNEPIMGPPSHESQWKGSEDLSGPVWRKKKSNVIFWTLMAEDACCHKCCCFRHKIITLVISFVNNGHENLWVCNWDIFLKKITNFQRNSVCHRKSPKKTSLYFYGSLLSKISYFQNGSLFQKAKSLSVFLVYQFTTGGGPTIAKL